MTGDGGSGGARADPLDAANPFSPDADTARRFAAIGTSAKGRTRGAHDHRSYSIV